MSAQGEKRTSRQVRAMSALSPKADIGTQPRNVRFVPKADIGLSLSTGSTAVVQKKQNGHVFEQSLCSPTASWRCQSRAFCEPPEPRGARWHQKKHSKLRAPTKKPGMLEGGCCGSSRSLHARAQP